MKIWLKKLKDFFKGVSKHPRFINVLSLIMYYYSRWVGKTTRWDIFGVNQLYQVWHQEKAIILVIWHGRAMMIPHFWNGQRPLNALVSLHKDGRIIAGFLEKYGFGTIGGSSNGGANSAALALLHSLQNDTAVAIIPAALMVEGVCRIENIPQISDVTLFFSILDELGAKVRVLNPHAVELDCRTIRSTRPSYELARRIRASYYLLGALLGRFGEATVAMPGGCDFGVRPIDQHIKGFVAMGADVEVKGGYVHASSGGPA